MEFILLFNLNHSLNKFDIKIVLDNSKKISQSLTETNNNILMFMLKN